MTGVRIFSPSRLRAIRGDRTQKDIVDRARNAFTEQAYSLWEKGVNEPTDANKAALVQALDITYDHISIPFEEAEYTNSNNI